MQACGLLKKVSTTLLLKNFVFCIFGEKAANQLDLLPPSKDTVTRRIIGMVADVKSMLIEHGMSHEDFLLCKLLPTRATGEHIFHLLSDFIGENGIDWIKCVGVCTDSARAMTSRHSGVVA
ncbi:ZBED5 protein, partial [Atractosteus spatula]|nr:ZBED5 protein [Atractosteus spatula]